MLKFLLRASLLLLLAAGTLVQAGEGPPPKGTLVIIGGGLRPDNDAVWQRIVDLAGGKGARIAVFGSASAAPEWAGNRDAARFKAAGANAFVVPVAVKLQGTDYRAMADNPQWADAVRNSGGAFFAGGDQSRITQALRHADGSNTLVLDALWDLYRRGGVISGTSAGAAIMSSTMFDKPKSVLATLKTGVADGDEISSGLGFIGDDVFVDQHLLVRGRFARMIPVMLKKGYKIGLGIDENTAMIIWPDREVEIVGYRGAMLIDLSQATTERGTFNITNARLSYLDAGDRYNMKTKTFMPGPEKRDGKLDPANPYYREPLFSADILGNSTVVDLMSKLIDSTQTDAIGLTLGSPLSIQPDIGFEFRLSRTRDSVGYLSASTESSSVYNIRIDVGPIQILLPMYQYKELMEKAPTPP